METLINSTITPLRVADIDLTDQYHISSLQLPHAVIKDIVYPYAIGREYMMIGGEHDDQTTLSVTFAESGDNRNRLYAYSFEDYWAKLAEISAALMLTPVCEVECFLFKEEHMRCELVLLDAPKVFMLRDRTCVGQAFELKTSRYKVA